MPDSPPRPPRSTRPRPPTSTACALSSGAPSSFRFIMPLAAVFSTCMSALAHTTRRGPQWLCVGLLTASCSASSCQSPNPGALESASLSVHSVSPRLDRYITLYRNFAFQDSTASSDIVAFFDPASGFVIADEGQTQVRVYSEDARLLWSAGSRGPGPAEFRQLRAAVRTSSGDVIAIDDAGKLVVFDSAGRYVRTKLTGLAPTYSLVLLNDSTLLISGRRGRDPRNPTLPLLHVWDLRRDTITRSFFTVPPHDARLEAGYLFSGWATATVLRGDTLGIVFPLADTLYRYLSDGTPIDKWRLPLRKFRRLRDPAPMNATPQTTIEWRNSYSRLSDVFAAPDGSIYIQYFNMKQLEPVFGLARFKFADHVLEKSFEVPEAPRLLGVSPRDSSLYFLQPDINTERVTWSVGRYSP
jgi:hypothetical protein